MHILYLTGRVPWPPYKGDQVRAYHQLAYLAKRHRVSLLCLTSEEVNNTSIERIQSLGVEMVVLPHRRLERILGAGVGLVRGLPGQVGLCRSNDLKRHVRTWLCEAVDLMFVQLSRLGEYVPHPGLGPPVVVDFVDCLALNMQNRAQTDASWRRWIAKWEARRLYSYERRLAMRASLGLITSSRDKEYLDPEGQFPLKALPNGVDCARFRPTGSRASVPTVIFHGNMGYFPNDEGARWFLREVWPRIIIPCPDARLLIVGTGPTVELQRIAAGMPGVTVTGAVPEIAPLLSAAHVAVCPLHSGSGLQNKVLEAMACETPVVATPTVVAGLDRRAQGEISTADSPLAFAEAVRDLLTDTARRREIGVAARKSVLALYDWECLGKELEMHLQQVVKIHERRKW